MSYAIVGFGKIGQALAHAFARRNIEVTVASRRPPEALAPEARAIGPTVVAKSLRDALEADTIILAVPFGEHREVARALSSWEGKTVIDAAQPLGGSPRRAVGEGGWGGEGSKTDRRANDRLGLPPGGGGPPPPPPFVGEAGPCCRRR